MSLCAYDLWPPLSLCWLIATSVTYSYNVQIGIRATQLSLGLTDSQHIAEDEKINSEDNLLEAELRRRQRAIPSLQLSRIQIKGWVEY